MFDPEQPGFDPAQAEIEARRKAILDQRDTYKEHATEFQRRIVEIQAAKYETTLHRLMARSKDDPELINALNGFLDALDHRSVYGREDQPLVAQEGLLKFFREKSEELRFLSGNRPSRS